LGSKVVERKTRERKREIRASSTKYQTIPKTQESGEGTLGVWGYLKRRQGSTEERGLWGK